MNNENNSNSILNNQNEFEPNINKTLNIEPPVTNISNTINEAHNFDNAFINRNFENNNEMNTNQNTFINLGQINNNIDNTLEFQSKNEINNQNIIQVIPNMNNTETNDESSSILNTPRNKFIQNDIDTTATSLNSLNIENNYNNTPKVDYSNDPKVQENIKKRNTVTITGEGKIFILIVAILLIFIFGLPTIFDLIRNIKY